MIAVALCFSFLASVGAQETCPNGAPCLDPAAESRGVNLLQVNDRRDQGAGEKETETKKEEIGSMQVFESDSHPECSKTSAHLKEKTKQIEKMEKNAPPECIKSSECSYNWETKCPDLCKEDDPEVKSYGELSKKFGDVIRAHEDLYLLLSRSRVLEQLGKKSTAWVPKKKLALKDVSNAFVDKEYRREQVKGALYDAEEFYLTVKGGGCSKKGHREPCKKVKPLPMSFPSNEILAKFLKGELTEDQVTEQVIKQFTKALLSELEAPIKKSLQAVFAAHKAAKTTAGSHKQVVTEWTKAKKEHDECTAKHCGKKQSKGCGKQADGDLDTVPCTCKHGTPVQGKCEVENKNKCTSCNEGYMKSKFDDGCEKDPRVACKCKNGTPVSGKVCKNVLFQREKCKSCKKGFSLDSAFHSCEEVWEPLGGLSTMHE